MKYRNHKDQDNPQHNDGNGQCDDGIGHRPLDLGLKLCRFFHVCGQTLQNGIQDTAGFSRGDHIHKQVVKVFRIFFQCVGKRGTAFHRLFDFFENVLKRLVFLLRIENIQALDDGKPGIDHCGELAGKENDVFLRNLRGKKNDIFRFFLYFCRSDAETV